METPGKVAIAVASITALGSITAAALGLIKPGDSPTSTSAPAASPHSTSQSAAGLPASYQGNWSGTYTYNSQGVTASTPLYLHLGPGSTGQTVGTVQLFDCSGSVEFSAGDGPVDLIFQISDNPTGQCNPTALAHATQISTTQLRLDSYSGSQVTGSADLNLG